MRIVIAAFAAFLWVGAARSETSYDAASAILSNGAEAHGGLVGHIGGDDDGRVVFSNVVVAAAGLYPMTVYFVVSDDRSLNVTVNHAAVTETVIFRRNARRRETSDQTVLVPLEAGANSIAFDNPREFGPELARITVADAPVESKSIHGVLRDGDGSPLANAEVRLSGTALRKTTTDARGSYEFRYLPAGDYRVTPQMPGLVFAPHDYLLTALTIHQTEEDFVARRFPLNSPNPVELASGHWRIIYDLANGTTDVLHDGQAILSNFCAEAQLPATVSSTDYATRKVTRRRAKYGFGSGMEFQVESANGDADKMVQTFWIYDGADYFLTRVDILRRKGAASNFLAPLVSHTPVRILPPGDNRALCVPFDNDKWIRYDAAPFGGEMTSYEVSAFYNNESRAGLVVGSIDHDTWKTGIKAVTDGNQLADLKAFGGITSATTRDMLPHGKVSGETIQSPRIFVGFFSDWRQGLDTFAKVNAKVAPPRPVDGGVPFGWNSWGKLQTNVTFKKAIEVSDFFASELQPRHFENRNVVYIGLDAGWSKFSDDQLKEFVQHCKANHQEAGIYFTPFADFRGRASEKVEGTHFFYKDLYLYANRQRQRIATGVALDPTHPGTKARIKYTIDRFKKFGFKYVKADFLVHGALEADQFFNPRVTTGLQAYNEGMKFLDQTLGRSMYLNLAISPLFPTQYADSRRIACDSWGDIGKVEYTLNSLTYGWWLGSLYDYNDPDHMVLGGYLDGENRARVTSAVLTGLLISGDDFSKDGDPEGKAKARRFLTNADIDALGRKREVFRPVEGNSGNRAANLFVAADGKLFYLVALNYSQSETNRSVPFERIGLNAAGPIRAKELWSGRSGQFSSPMEFQIPPGDAVVYEIAE